jgi:hypothetical protein
LDALSRAVVNPVIEEPGSVIGQLF